MARRSEEPLRVTTITEVPDPNGERWRAILALLLEAGLEEEARHAG
jgi:hypothetical protein